MCLYLHFQCLCVSFRVMMEQVAFSESDPMYVYFCVSSKDGDGASGSDLIPATVNCSGQNSAQSSPKVRQTPDCWPNFAPLSAKVIWTAEPSLCWSKLSLSNNQVDAFSPINRCWSQIFLTLRKQSARSSFFWNLRDIFESWETLLKITRIIHIAESLAFHLDFSHSVLLINL